MANTTDCPGTLNCPALPRVSLDQAVIDLLESIALEETALSHILNAEGEKIQKVLAQEPADFCRIVEVNESVVNMVSAVSTLLLLFLRQTLHKSAFLPVLTLSHTQTRLLHRLEV